MKGTWETTSGGDGAKMVTALVGLAAAAVIVHEALKSAARTLGDLLVIIPVAVVALVAGVGVTVLVVRLRGRRRARPAPAVQLWQPNPLAAPSKPQVTQGTAPPAIEYHVHHHHHYAASPEPARVVIPGKLLP